MMMSGTRLQAFSQVTSVRAAESLLDRTCKWDAKGLDQLALYELGTIMRLLF